MGQPSVLIVDDEPGAREALREVVEMAGFSALMASDGAEALKLLAELAEHRPCMVIMDLVMPVMTGLDLLRAIQTDPALEGLSVVVSTSSPGRAPPGVPVFAKPIDILALWSCMRRLCPCATPPRAP